MSPTTEETSAPSGKQGIRKYVSRIKSALKGESSSKPAIPTAASRPVTAAGIQATAVSVPNQYTINRPPPIPLEADPDAQINDQSVMQLQPSSTRTRFQHAVSGVGLSPTPKPREPSRASTGLVHKPIRMRVHRSCHQCGVTFGACRICVVCTHTRCELCPRYPARNSKGNDAIVVEKGKSIEMVPVEIGPNNVAAIPPVVDINDDSLKRKHMLMKRNPNAGPEIVRKKPMQRALRTCHLCQTPFKHDSKDCSGCKHVRCYECPREVIRAQKYLDGPMDPDPAIADPASANNSVPVDRIYRRPIRITRFICHACSATFRADTASCSSCGHDKCDECLRIPPLRPADPASSEGGAMPSVEEKLLAMDFERLNADGNEHVAAGLDDPRLQSATSRQ